MTLVPNKYTTNKDDFDHLIEPSINNKYTLKFKLIGHNPNTLELGLILIQTTENERNENLHDEIRIWKKH